jgi:hypothetical protein
MSALDEKRSPSEEKVTADRLATDDASSNDESLVPVPQAVLDESTVNNPLAGIPKAQLLRDVEIFAQEKGLTDHLEGLQRGALLAQRPADFQSIEELPQDEKDAIAHEYSHKWSHPFLLYMTIFTCSIGAATQGWDQTGSNGANLSFPVAFNIPEAASEGIAPGAPGYVSAALAERNQWIVGIVNAAPYIASAMIGCWLSDPLNNLFGRRGCIFITAVILVVTPIASGFTQNWWELFIVRLLLGIGMGAKGSTVPVFAAENSPAQIRGALVMGWQLWTVRIHPLTTLFFNGMIPELTRETLLFILCSIRLLVSSSVSLQTSWSPTRAIFRGVCSSDPPSFPRCRLPSSSTSAPSRLAGS